MNNDTNNRSARREHAQARAEAKAASIARPKRRGAALVLVITLVIVAIACGGVFFSWTLLTGSDTHAAKGTEVTFEIPAGSNSTAIAKILADSGIVVNANMFRLMTRVRDTDGSYKAGVYTLTAGMSYDDAILALQQGPLRTYVTVTIPEGKTIDQVAAIVEEKTGVSADEFTTLAKSGSSEFTKEFPYLKGAYGDSLEGFLFPDTYRVDEAATAHDVINMMLARFDEVYSSLDISKSRSKKYTVHELITIASLVEREARVEKERPLVASVVDNRLAKGMKLQFCSTVQFLLPGEEERTKIRLTNADISIKSPYNTYLNKGLPPGPIANPGKAALQAAVKPADTSYIYFVLTGKDGSQTFASTSAQFAAAKAKSKAVLGE